MLKRMVLGLLLVALPGVACAQNVQDSYLPAKSQIYFRWDGMVAHRAAFDKTAMGKMMQGETGKFLDELWAFAHDNLKNAAQNEPKLEVYLKDFTKLLGATHNYGVVLGVQVEKVQPPMVQAVVVFPKAAGESGTVMPLIVKIAEEARAEVKSAKVGKRFINNVDVGPVKIAWWGQGNDAILFVGTTDPAAYAKAVDAKETGLANNPLYKKVTGFKEFTTCARGYVDVASALDLAAQVAPPISGKVIDELGLKSLKNITFVTGFDGPAERAVVDVEVPGPRKGILSLASTKKISLKSLPVLPDDITGFSAGTIGANKFYGELVSAALGTVRIFDADKADEIKDAINAFQGAVGVDIDRDLFGNLGDVYVAYSSPSDGILGTGAVTAIQVKDGKKIVSTLDKIVKGIPANPLGEVTLKRRGYRGAELVDLAINGPQFNRHIATVGIYKNWLVYSSYPPAVKGFILRQEGMLPAWKADAALAKELSKFPDEFTSISVSDPRPTVRTLVAAAPFVLDLVNMGGAAVAQFGGGFNYRPFDLDAIPNAQEATMHLFPNISVTTDDGKHVRTESRTSLGF